MQWLKDQIDRIGTLIKADVSSFAAADTPAIRPLVADFVESANFDVASAVYHADLPTLNFNENALAVEGRDPATGDIIVRFQMPEGGLRWELSVDPEDPINVYGYLITDTNGDGVGLIKLDDPVTLFQENDELICEDPAFRIKLAGLV